MSSPILDHLPKIRDVIYRRPLIKKLFYLPFDADMRGLASSESALMATAFLKLFMAFPPTLAALAALAVRLGLA